MAAFGNVDFPALPGVGLNAGFSSELGTVLPAGRVAAYVCASPSQSLIDQIGPSRPILSTLNAGLAQCRSGAGDTVVVLPGHAENISAADQMTSLVAGTKIVGIGHGSLRPTFTWTTATSTFLFDVASVSLSGCILKMAGPSGTTALSVAAPITVSAAYCSISNCLAEVGIDADQLATIPITTTAGGTDLTLSGVHIYGAAAAPVTTCIRLVGADRFKLLDSYVIAETSAAGVGVVQCITTASLQILVQDSTMVNLKSDSTAAFTGLAGCSGVLMRCGIGYYGNSGLTAITTAGDLQAFFCQTVNEQGETGAASTVVST